MFARTTLCLILLVACASSLALAQSESADEVIEKALSNRLKIHSYDIELSYHGGDSQPVPRIVRSHHYRQDNTLRVDYGYLDLGIHSLSELNNAFHWDREVFCPGKWTRFCSGRQLEICTNPDRIQETLSEARINLDIRSLGFCTAGAIDSYGIEDFLKTLALPGKTATRDVVDGVETIRIEFKLKSGVECRFWFAPGYGYAPIKARGHYPPFNFIDEINLTVEEWKNSGLWFPTSYRSTRQASNEIYSVDNATVKIHSLNEPLAQKTFDASGLGVPVGRRVRIISPTGTKTRPKMKWDGEKPVAE